MSLKLPEAPKELSLSGIGAYTLSCTECGFPNSLSLIPIDNKCKCRSCSALFDVSKASDMMSNRSGMNWLPEVGVTSERSPMSPIAVLVGGFALGFIFVGLAGILQRRRRNR